MGERIAKRFVVAKPFEGLIDERFISLEEEELPPVQDGGFLAEAAFLSVEPYNRAHADSYTIGETIEGLQVARITESKNKKFPTGSYVVGKFGWRTKTVVNEPDKLDHLIYVVPEDDPLPPSYRLGVLGIPGITAYFGLIDILKPQQGETLVVTGGAGAVGHVVGQIGKILGCKVIGIAGNDEKLKWLKEIGFDHAINYKTGNVEEELKKAAPEGVDVYFDNVGGEISSTIMYQMRQKGRVGVCGAISSYNDIVKPKATIIQPAVLFRRFIIKPVVVAEYSDRWHEAIDVLHEWIKDGKIKTRETVYVGFETMPKALFGLFTGENTGKSIIKIPTIDEEQAINFKKVLNTFKGLTNNV